MIITKEAIDRVRSGDEETFDLIYQETIQPIYRTLYFLLLDNKHDLEDIVQEVYIELFRSLPNYDTTRSFQAWVYGLLMRQHQAYRRRQWRSGRKEARFQQANNPVFEADFSTTVIQRISEEHLYHRIGQLSVKHREVIILHYLNDLTHVEMASILQIPVGTVKSRLHAALSKLRENLKEEDLCMKI